MISYTIEEWVPPKPAIGAKGFWYELDAAEFEDYDQAMTTFGSLMSKGRTVRLQKHTAETVAECAVPPWEQ